MNEHVVIVPLLVALITAVSALLVHGNRRVQVGVSVLGAVGYVVAVAALVARVYNGGIATYQLGAWPAPFGITLVADGLSVFMLGMAAVVSLLSLVHAVTHVDEFGQRLTFHPLYHFMMVGVSGAFLTGDAFNLFVWFEVMLMASYVLVVFYSGPEQTSAAIQYVVLNLIGGALMLLAVGGLYATTGTLNLADMARRLSNPAAFGIDPAPVLGLSALLFVVFALKAGLVPFHFWVPGAYQAAPAPVAAMLAGVVKKVGVYAIIRLYFTVFAAASFPGGLGLPGLNGSSFLSFYGPVMFVLATASILVGGFGAVSRDQVEELLAFSSVGQVGFIILPLAVAATVPALAPFGIAAALVYSLNHALAKSMLFLAAGTISDLVGSARFADLGGLAERVPYIAGAFFIGALALIGIPPLTGFFGKFLIFDVAVQAGSDLGAAVALVGAALTIAYFSRAWNRGFWGDPSGLPDVLSPRRTEVAVLVVFAALIVGLGIGFDPIVDAALTGGDAAVARDAYIDAVLGGGGA